MSDTNQSQTVFYLRGLSTWGDEFFRAGPWLKLGRMDQNIKIIFDEEGWPFVSIQGMKVGSLREMSERAMAFIRNHQEWKEGHKIHLLGHSTGGLIARALAHFPETADRIISITTVGTPHFGTPLIQWAKNYPDHYPIKNQLLKLSGYSIKDRFKFLEQLSPPHIADFNQTHTNLPSIKYFSFVGALSKIQQLGFAMKTFNSGVPLPSDGMVPVASQEWGEVLGHFALDHTDEIGYHLHLSPAQQQVARSEFQRMMSTYLHRLADFNTP